MSARWKDRCRDLRLWLRGDSEPVMVYRLVLVVETGIAIVQPAAKTSLSWETRPRSAVG